MKKALWIFAAALLLPALCSGLALAADYPLDTVPQAYSYPSGATRVERSSLAADPASFTAALAKARAGDVLVIAVSGAEPYYTVQVRADLLKAAADQGVTVEVRQREEGLIKARTLPNVAEQAAALYPDRPLTEVTLYYSLRWEAATDFEQQLDAEERQAFAVANIELDPEYPLETVSLRLVGGEEVKPLNATQPFSYSLYTVDEPDHLLQLFALDNNGRIRRVQDYVRRAELEGESYYRHWWTFTGSHVEARGLMGEMPAVPGLAGAWAEEHYQNNYYYGHFLNFGNSAAEFPPEAALTRTRMMGVMLNLFSLQEPAVGEPALTDAAGLPAYLRQRLSGIDTATAEGLALFRTALTYERWFGPDEAALAAYPEARRVIVIDETLPRLAPVTGLYRYLRQVFGDGMTEAEAGQALAGFEDAAGLTGETKLAFAYAVKHGWITGDDQGRLRAYEEMTNAEFVALMDRAGHNVGRYAVYGEMYLAKE